MRVGEGDMTECEIVPCNFVGEIVIGYISRKLNHGFL